MKNPLKRNPIAAAETELANLAARRETLESRRTAAIAALEAARSARKNALASDPAAELTGLTRAVRDGEDEIETLSGVLTDLADQVADAERRLAEAKDADVRAAASAELTQVGSAFVEAAQALDKLLAPLPEILAAISATIPKTLEVFTPDPRPANRPESGPVSGRELAAMVMIEALAHVVPDAFDVVWSAAGDYRVTVGSHQLIRFQGLDGQSPGYLASAESLSNHKAGVSAAEAASMLVKDRLHRRAHEILAGEASSNIVDICEVATPPEAAASKPSLSVTNIFVKENFKYRVSTSERPELVAAGQIKTVPTVVGRAAILSKTAFDPDTERGVAEIQNYRQQNPNHAKPASLFLDEARCVDLGFFEVAA